MLGQTGLTFRQEILCKTYMHASCHHTDTMAQFELFKFIHFQRSQADPKVFNTTFEQIGDRGRRADLLWSLTLKSRRKSDDELKRHRVKQPAMPGVCTKYNHNIYKRASRHTHIFSKSPPQMWSSCNIWEKKICHRGGIFYRKSVNFSV